MEYPTFITGGTYFWPGKYSMNPEGVTVHEFGHQFWYGLVGNNEFEESWLDEGFNTYSTGKVMDLAYGPRNMPASILGIPAAGSLARARRWHGQRGAIENRAAAARCRTLRP